MEKINIITRTSNRPNYFAKCYESIRLATSLVECEVVHWVTYDNVKDLKYLENYADIKTIFIDEDWLKQAMQTDIINPKTGPSAPYNLYINRVMQEIEDGWILILDDDDTVDEKFFIEISSIEKTHRDILIYQMRYETGMVLPSAYNFNKPPMLGQIGSPCIYFHYELAKNTKWDGWKCGDYRFISKIYKMSNKQIWLRKPLIHIGSKGGNLGKKNDINQNKIELKLKNISVAKPTDNKNIIKAFSRLISPDEPDIINSKDQLNKIYVTDKPIIVAIPTYNRFTFIKDIIEYFQKKENVQLIIIDDCSNESNYKKLESIVDLNNTILLRNKKNLGKQGYWRTINNLFQQIKNFEKSDYIIQLDDDIKLCDNFLPRVIDVFEKNGKDCHAFRLHQSHENDKIRWGTANWVDGITLYRSSFWKEIEYKIDPIDKSRWMVNKKLSSGVWQQVTNKLNALKYKVLFTGESYVLHLGDGYGSQMHSKDIYKQRLVTKNFKP